MAIVVSAFIVVPRFVSTPAGNLMSQRSLCQRTDDLLTAAESVPDQPDDVSSVLSEQMPDVPGFGLILPLDAPSHTASDLADGRTDASDWVNELTTNGYQDGLERWWVGPYTAAATEVLRFGSHIGALGFQRWIIHASCWNASDVFAVDGLPGSIGLQLHWENGDVSEQVSFVRGPYRYLASTRSGEAPPRWWVTDITHHLAATLGIGWSAPITPCDEASNRIRSVDRLPEPQPPRTSTPMTLLPTSFETKDDPAMPGSSQTTATHEPVYTGIREDFAGAWHDQLKARGYSAGAERLWKFPDGTAIGTVESFGTHRDAIAYQRWYVENVVCVTATEVFAPDVSAAIGLRSPWGPARTADIVSFVRGRYHFDIYSFTTDVPADHARADSIAQSAAEAID